MLQVMKNIRKKSIRNPNNTSAGSNPLSTSSGNNSILDPIRELVARSPQVQKNFMDESSSLNSECFITKELFFKTMRMEAKFQKSSAMKDKFIKKSASSESKTRVIVRKIDVTQRELIPLTGCSNNSKPVNNNTGLQGSLRTISENNVNGIKQECFRSQIQKPKPLQSNGCTGIISKIENPSEIIIPDNSTSLAVNIVTSNLDAGIQDTLLQRNSLSVVKDETKPLQINGRTGNESLLETRPSSIITSVADQDCILSVVKNEPKTLQTNGYIGNENSVETIPDSIISLEEALPDGIPSKDSFNEIKSEFVDADSLFKLNINSFSPFIEADDSTSLFDKFEEWTISNDHNQSSLLADDLKMNLRSGNTSIEQNQLGDCIFEMQSENTANEQNQLFDYNSVMHSNISNSESLNKDNEVKVNNTLFQAPGTVESGIVTPDLLMESELISFPEILERSCENLGVMVGCSIEEVPCVEIELISEVETASTLEQSLISHNSSSSDCVEPPSNLQLCDTENITNLNFSSDSNSNLNSLYSPLTLGTSNNIEQKKCKNQELKPDRYNKPFNINKHEETKMNHNKTEKHNGNLVSNKTISSNMCKQNIDNCSQSSRFSGTFISVTSASNANKIVRVKPLSENCNNIKQTLPFEIKSNSQINLMNKTIENSALSDHNYYALPENMSSAQQKTSNAKCKKNIEDKACSEISNVEKSQPTGVIKNEVDGSKTTRKKKVDFNTYKQKFLKKDSKIPKSSNFSEKTDGTKSAEKLSWEEEQKLMRSILFAKPKSQMEVESTTSSSSTSVHASVKLMQNQDKDRNLKSNPESSLKEQKFKPAHNSAFRILPFVPHKNVSSSQPRRPHMNASSNSVSTSSPPHEHPGKELHTKLNGKSQSVLKVQVPSSRKEDSTPSNSTRSSYPQENMNARYITLEGRKWQVVMDGKVVVPNKDQSSLPHANKQSHLSHSALSTRSQSSSPQSAISNKSQSCSPQSVLSSKSQSSSPHSAIISKSQSSSPHSALTSKSLSSSPLSAISSKSQSSSPQSAITSKSQSSSPQSTGSISQLQPETKLVQLWDGECQHLLSVEAISSRNNQLSLSQINHSNHISVNFLPNSLIVHNQTKGGRYQNMVSVSSLETITSNLESKPTSPNTNTDYLVTGAHIKNIKQMQSEKDNTQDVCGETKIVVQKPLSVSEKALELQVMHNLKNTPREMVEAKVMSSLKVPQNQENIAKDIQFKSKFVQSLKPVQQVSNKTAESPIDSSCTTRATSFPKIQLKIGQTKSSKILPTHVNPKQVALRNIGVNTNPITLEDMSNIKTVMPMFQGKPITQHSLFSSILENVELKTQQVPQQSPLVEIDTVICMKYQKPHSQKDAATQTELKLIITTNEIKQLRPSRITSQNNYKRKRSRSSSSSSTNSSVSYCSRKRHRSSSSSASSSSRASSSGKRKKGRRRSHSSSSSSSSSSRASSSGRRTNRRRRRRPSSSSSSYLSSSSASSSGDICRSGSTSSRPHSATSSYSRQSSTYSRSRSEHRHRQRPQPDFKEDAINRSVVFVGNIPNTDNVKEKDLQRRFRKFGTIKKISLHKKNEKFGYGFVTFCKRESADSAIEHGNDDPSLPKYTLSYGGRRIFCEMQYADLDKMREREELYGRQMPQNNKVDFSDMLSQYARQRGLSIRKQ